MGLTVLTDRVDVVRSGYPATGCVCGCQVAGFVGGRAQVAEAGVRPAGVVPAFEVLENRPCARHSKSARAAGRTVRL